MARETRLPGIQRGTSRTAIRGDGAGSDPDHGATTATIGMMTGVKRSRARSSVATEPPVIANNVHGDHGHSHDATTHELHPHAHRDDVNRRLARAAGHLEAVRRMAQTGRECPELLRQIAAVRAALDATAKIILADHIESCLHGAVEGGDAEVAWADLRTALETFIR